MSPVVSLLGLVAGVTAYVILIGVDGLQWRMIVNSHAKAADPEVVEEPAKGEFRPARPNKLWPEEVRALIRFYVSAKGEVLAPCPVCKSRKRGRWTMLCPFRAFTLEQSEVRPSDGELMPLTLVCSEHPISPTDAIMKAL